MAYAPVYEISVEELLNRNKIRAQASSPDMLARDPVVPGVYDKENQKVVDGVDKNQNLTRTVARLKRQVLALKGEVSTLQAQLASYQLLD